MSERITKELELLRSVFPEIRFEPQGNWFLIPAYRDLGSVPWSPNPLPVAFRPKPLHPGQEPYGIWVPTGTKVGEHPPENFQDPAAEQPPFPGKWGLLSWTTKEGAWRPKDSVAKGSNLLDFAVGFKARFQAGR